jgi:hypothetical protein
VSTEKLGDLTPGSYGPGACVNCKLKLEKNNLERNAKKILGFGHFFSHIRDIEKNCLNIKKKLPPKKS